MVKIVDVLRNEFGNMSQPLQCRNGVMCLVRLGVPDRREAQVRARPVALPDSIPITSVLCASHVHALPEHAPIEMTFGTVVREFVKEDGSI